MEIRNYEPKQLENILFGIKEMYNYNEPINDNYNIRFEIRDINPHEFKVTAFYDLGNHVDDDERVVSVNNFFIINKNEGFRKFTKEANCLIDSIVSIPYDDEMDNDEFNILNND